MSRRSFLIVEYSMQRKGKWGIVSVSRPHLHIESIKSRKPYLNLSSFKRLKFNLRRVSSLISLVSYITKTEYSLGLIKDYFFKFIYWYYDSNFFTKCTPILNREWIKRRIESFCSSRKSLLRVLTSEPLLVLSIITMI